MSAQPAIEFNSYLNRFSHNDIWPLLVIKAEHKVWLQPFTGFIAKRLMRNHFGWLLTNTLSLFLKPTTSSSRK